MMQWFAFDTLDEQVNALAQRVIIDLTSWLIRQRMVVLAVSGGRSPLPLFHKLSTADIDWQRVVVTLVDDRCVPEHHPHSNAQLVKTHLLTARASQAIFRPLVTWPDNAQASEAEAIRHFQYPNVAILGMGEDGHTASLFPGAVELEVGLALSTLPPVITLTPPVAPHLRLTLTRAALLKAGSLYLAIQGEAKRKVLVQACEQAIPLLPISYFVQQTKVSLDVYWAP